MRKESNGYQAVRCGKEATDFRVSVAGKEQQISGSQVREGSNRFQGLGCGKGATGVRFPGTWKKYFFPNILGTLRA
jgi:hypothetical protein